MKSYYFLSQADSLNFRGIINYAAKNYRKFFLNYILLGIITFTPFILISKLTTFDTMGLSGFISARFFDIIVFITLPTVITQRKVFPIASLQIFFQAYFGKVVLFCIIQLSLITLSVLILVSISPAFIFLAFFIYLFLLFPGYFLVMSSADGSRATSECFMESFFFVRKNLVIIFPSIISIAILCSIPLISFIVFYTSQSIGADTIAQISSSSQNLETALADFSFRQEVQEAMNSPILNIGVFVIQILVRPFESLFISFLFLSCLYRISPVLTTQYFFGSTEESENKTFKAADNFNEAPDQIDGSSIDSEKADNSQKDPAQSDNKPNDNDRNF